MLRNVLIGYATPHLKTRLGLPFMVSICVLLIADIDSPRGGVIHLGPQNRLSLAATLH